MATFALAGKSVSLEFRRLVLLLILKNFISDCTGRTISLTCPSVEERQITKFNCSVPTSMCRHSYVFFEFVKKDQTAESLCWTSSSNTCNQQPAGNMTCGCVLSNSYFKYYQLNFWGEKTTYDGGMLTCTVDCMLRPYPGICQSISYAGSGSSMHVLRTAIVASMSGIIALISTHLRSLNRTHLKTFLAEQSTLHKDTVSVSELIR